MSPAAKTPEKKTSPWFWVGAGAVMVAIMVVALVLRFRNDAGSNQRGGKSIEQPPTDDNPGAENGPTPVIVADAHPDAGAAHVTPPPVTGDAGTGELPMPPFAPPQVKPADPVEPPLEGEVSVDLTRRSISAIMVEARRCVQQGRQTKPDMIGQVMMNYTLVVKGGKASVMTPFLPSSDLKDPATEDCIVSSAAAQTIDAKGEPDGHTRMRVPLVFGKDLPK